MNTVASHQVIQTSKIDVAASSGLGKFLLGPLGVALGFLWGFVEATLFFVVPDVWLSLVAIFSLRRVWQHIAAAITGAAAGGALIFLWAQTHPDSASAVVNKVPFVTKQMFAKVDVSFQTRGLSAVYVGPLTGLLTRFMRLRHQGSCRFHPFCLPLFWREAGGSFWSVCSPAHAPERFANTGMRLCGS